MRHTTTKEVAAAATMKARKDLARERGELYLDFAHRYFTQGDTKNALSTIEEGIRLTAGPFYLAVADRLSDLKRTIVNQPERVAA
jgi:Tfp pilus assembly protein PilF